MYNIFISHKQEDIIHAEKVSEILRNLGVNTYLDVTDAEVSQMDAISLTKHIKNKICSCTDIMVLLSDKTRESWWVPFELGVAYQRNMPISKFFIKDCVIPEYLEGWPDLKSFADLQIYTKVRMEVARSRNFTFEQTSFMDESEVDIFYDKLKRKLKEDNK